MMKGQLVLTGASTVLVLAVIIYTAPVRKCIIFYSSDILATYTSAKIL